MRERTEPSCVSRWSILTLVFLGALCGLPLRAIQTRAPQAVDELKRAAGGGAEVTVSPTTGLATFLTTAPGRPVLGTLSASAPAAERALDFLALHGAAFGIADPATLALMRVSAPDEVGMEHARFRQTYRGVPVTGGEVTVHLRGADVVAVNAHTLDGLEGIDVTPALAAPEAKAAVARWLAETLGVTDAVISEPRLELLNRGLLEGRTHFTRLAWFVEARRTGLREFIWIDAGAAKPLLQFSQLTDALDRDIYDADDPGDGVFNNLPGALVRVEGGAATGDADADNAYDFAGDTYDYFFNEHGRDSYDDAGSTLPASVHFCPTAAAVDCPYPNAFWNGTQMVYGEGVSQADDVDAHELTHAVTEHTANLFYYMQSGALNESFSDIFGETVDLTNGAGDDSPGVRWALGEDIPPVSPIPSPLRDMEDPTIFGDPGKVSDAQFVCGDYRTDNGGVHSNSGVPNHAYALMVDGGTYNSQTVTGIGLTKAGKIEYRTLAHYLLSASDFLDDYNALKQSCQDLIGIAGITLADCTEVGEALDAVEMNSVWNCSPPTQASAPAFCPAGQAPSIWSYENFEGVPLTACPSGGVSTSWCTNGPTSLVGAFATSGVYSAWGYDRPTAGTQTLTVTYGVSLPASARMQFNHSFGFDSFAGTYYDGGVIETSTNGGGAWSDAGGLITAGQSYGGTLSACCSNPYGGLSAFVNQSWGFTASQLDLSSLVGGSFAFRLRNATDSSVDDYGWFVDDIRIYTCAACLTDRTLGAEYNGTASLYKATNSVTAGSGFKVGVAEDVTFEAGDHITLNDGFSVDGGTFTATITPGVCP
jgi:bacillolysin